MNSDGDGRRGRQQGSPIAGGCQSGNATNTTRTDAHKVVDEADAVPPPVLDESDTDEATPGTAKGALVVQKGREAVVTVRDVKDAVLEKARTAGEHVVETVRDAKEKAVTIGHSAAHSTAEALRMVADKVDPKIRGKL